MRSWKLLCAGSWLCACCVITGALGCQPKAEPAPAAAEVEERLVRAERQLQEAQYRNAIELFESILEHDANHARALAGMAEANARLQHPEEALAFAKRAAAAGRDDDHAQRRVGWVLSSLDQPGPAAEAYGRAFELDPSDARTGMRWGIELRKAGQLDASEQALLKAIEADSYIQYVHSELGDTLRALERWDDALAAYMVAQSRYKDDTTARAGAAYVFEQQGKYSLAADEWSAYIQMDCCSERSNTVAKPKLEEMLAKEQERIDQQP